jgi:hypothetical protein
MGIVDRNRELIDELAYQAGMEVRAVRALFAVESRDEGLVDGNPTIRLEVNHLWRLAPKAARIVIDRLFHVRGPEPWEGHEFRRNGVWHDLHQPGKAGQALERIALAAAKNISYDAAVGATSWGAGQVMGWHWRGLGFPTLQAFEAAQSKESGQIRTFFLYCTRIGMLSEPLARHDWLEVARRYNGPGKAADYAEKLAAAYEASG